MLTVAVLAIAAGAADPAPLTAQQIMQRVIARFEANALLREGIAYRKTEVVSGLDEQLGDPQVKRTGVWRMWVARGEVWQQKLLHDGEPVREQPRKPGVDLTSGLARYFDYELADPPLAVVRDHLCWVIRFTPSGRGNPSTVEEEVSSRLAGTFWVDARGYWIRRTEGHLVSHYTKRKLGIPLGTVYDAFLRMEQHEVLGAIMPLSATFDVHYRKLILDVRERYEYRYDEFVLQPKR